MIPGMCYLKPMITKLCARHYIALVGFFVGSRSYDRWKLSSYFIAEYGCSALDWIWVLRRLVNNQQHEGNGVTPIDLSTQPWQPADHHRETLIIGLD